MTPDPVPDRVSGPADAAPYDAAPYDALLVVSFGGPERPEDVLPFLENVTRGRAIPRERLEEVGAALPPVRRQEPAQRPQPRVRRRGRGGLRGQRLGLPVYWGNRNWDPYLPDALRQMTTDGVRAGGVPLHQRLLQLLRVPAVPREPRRRRRRGRRSPPRLDRVRHYFNHPGFVEPMVDATLAALAELPGGARGDARLLFVTHSIPTVDERGQRPRRRAAPDRARRCRGGAYVAQHQSVAAEITERIRQHTGHRFAAELVFCSRSGARGPRGSSPTSATGSEAGAKQGAGRGRRARSASSPTTWRSSTTSTPRPARPRRTAGVAFARAATAGVDPRFVSMVRELVLERAAAERARAGRRGPTAAVGPLAASWDACPLGCCANAAGPPARPCAAGTEERTAAGAPSSTDRPRSGAARRRRRGGRRGGGARAGPAPRRRGGRRPRRAAPSDIVTEVDRESEAFLRAGSPSPPRRRLPGRGGRGAGTVDDRRDLGRGPDRRHRQLPLRHPALLRQRGRRRRRGDSLAGAGGRRDERRGLQRGPGRRAPPSTATRCGSAAGRRWRSGWSSPASSTKQSVRGSRARPWRRMIDQVRDIRRMGSAALELCAIAAGAADAYVEEGLHLWDRAAAGLVATEAGATGRGAPRGRGDGLVVCAPSDVRRVLGPRPGVRLPRREARREPRADR